MAGLAVEMDYAISKRRLLIIWGVVQLMANSVPQPGGLLGEHDLLRLVPPGDLFEAFDHLSASGRFVRKEHLPRLGGPDGPRRSGIAMPWPHRCR